MKKGKTVLSFELTCRTTDKLWKKTDRELYEIVLEDCKQVPLLNKNIKHITNYTVRRAPDVYECYYKNFNTYAETVLDYIKEEIQNTVTIGRRGMFLQGDMHQSVEMGINMGTKLITEISGKKKTDLKKLKTDYTNEYAKYLDNT